MHQYFDGYIYYDECSHHATPSVLYYYSNEHIRYCKCCNYATL